MKKLYYRDENACESNYIYTDLPECFGCKYIAQTSGYPITDEDDPDAIESVIEAQLDDGYEWEDCNDDDMAYVMGLAEAWGINK